MHIGLPASEHKRVATFIWPGPPPAEHEPPGLDPAQLMEHNSYYNPGGLSGAGVINTPRWRSAEMPVHQRARHRPRRRPRLRRADQPADPAIVDPAALAEAIAEQVYGQDLVLHRPSRFGLGFQLTQPERPIGPGQATFGHFGAGGSLGFADPENEIAFGYVMNQMGPRWQNPRTRALVDAVTNPWAVTFPERLPSTVVIMGDAGPARRPATHPAAWWLTMLTLAVLAAALVFTVLNTSRIGMGRIGLGAILSAAVLLYAVSGRLIASRRPDNAIGWLLGSIGLSVATSMFAEQYALYGVATAPGAVPAAKAVGCLAAVGAFATVLLLFFIVLLFPDGHLPSPRWRPVLWATVVVFAGWGTQQFQAGTTVTGGLTNALQAGDATYPNPVGFLPRHGWYSDLLTVIFVLAVFTVIAVVASVFARRRGASPERRQQLAWLGYVGALTVTWILWLGPGQLARARPLRQLARRPCSGA